MGFDQVSDGARKGLAELANGARRELVHAGLPIREGTDLRSPGAEIEIDLGDDEAGGVFVTWHADGSLTEAAARSVSEGRLDDPTIQQSGAISQAMRDSMIAILRAAQYVAEASDDDMRPLALRVMACPSES